MQSNTFIEIYESFKGVPDSTFIKNRDKKKDDYEAGIRGADCEFPEYHQGQVDDKQTNHLTSIAIDNTHTDLGVLEYKQFSKAGVKMNSYTQKQIRENNIDYIVVWRWSDGNRYKTLVENEPIGYEILEYVDAKWALENLDKETNRFPFEINNVQMSEIAV